jgi:hypothetical protein
MGDVRPHGLPAVLRQTVPAVRPLGRLLRAQHGASLPPLVRSGDPPEYVEQLLRRTLVCVAKGSAAAPPQLPPLSQCSMVPRSSMNEARVARRPYTPATPTSPDGGARAVPTGWHLRGATWVVVRVEGTPNGDAVDQPHCNVVHCRTTARERHNGLMQSQAVTTDA